MNFNASLKSFFHQKLLSIQSIISLLDVALEHYKAGRFSEAANCFNAVVDSKVKEKRTILPVLLFNCARANHQAAMQAGVHPENRKIFLQKAVQHYETLRRQNHSKANFYLGELYYLENKDRSSAQPYKADVPYEGQGPLVKAFICLGAAYIENKSTLEKEKTNQKTIEKLNEMQHKIEVYCADLRCRVGDQMQYLVGDFIWTKDGIKLLELASIYNSSFEGYYVAHPSEKSMVEKAMAVAKPNLFGIWRKYQGHGAKAFYLTHNPEILAKQLEYLTGTVAESGDAWPFAMADQFFSVTRNGVALDLRMNILNSNIPTMLACTQKNVLSDFGQSFIASTAAGSELPPVPLPKTISLRCPLDSVSDIVDLLTTTFAHTRKIVFKVPSDDGGFGVIVIENKVAKLNQFLEILFQMKPNTVGQLVVPPVYASFFQSLVITKDPCVIAQEYLSDKTTKDGRTLRACFLVSRRSGQLTTQLVEGFFRQVEGNDGICHLGSTVDTLSPGERAELRDFIEKTHPTSFSAFLGHMMQISLDHCLQTLLNAEDTDKTRFKFANVLIENGYDSAARTLLDELSEREPLQVDVLRCKIQMLSGDYATALAGVDALISQVESRPNRQGDEDALCFQLSIYKYRLNYLLGRQSQDTETKQAFYKIAYRICVGLKEKIPVHAVQFYAEESDFLKQAYLDSLTHAS